MKLQGMPRQPTKTTSCIVVLLLVTCSIAIGCRPPDAPPPAKDGVLASTVEAKPAKPAEQLELALNWFPEVEHGGYFAALLQGYYEQAGLAVKILPGGPNAPVIQRVASKQVAFGVENADRILLGRAQEADVVALMAPIQKSPRSIMVHRKSGIRRIQDLANVTLAVNSGAAWMQYLKKRLPLSNVRFVPYSGNVAQFLVNDNYAQQAYVFSELFVAQQKGSDPDCLLVAETGYNPYTSVLIASADFIKSKPELVRRFVAASVRGWQTYLAQPDLTNRYLNEVNPEMSPEILAFGVKALQPLCLDRLPDSKSLGQMTSERWRSLLSQLVEANVVKAGVADSDHAFTVEFLRRPK